jgi:hypothetical protein
VDFTILDVSDYEPPRAPSKTWRELIKSFVVEKRRVRKVWEMIFGFKIWDVIRRAGCQ